MYRTEALNLTLAGSVCASGQTGCAVGRIAARPAGSGQSLMTYCADARGIRRRPPLSRDRDAGALSAPRNGVSEAAVAAVTSTFGADSGHIGGSRSVPPADRVFAELQRSRQIFSNRLPLISAMCWCLSGTRDRGSRNHPKYAGGVDGSRPAHVHYRNAETRRGADDLHRTHPGVGAAAIG